MEVNEELKEKLAPLRQRFESHILNIFHRQDVWYQQKRTQLNGSAQITTDDWGVSIRFENSQHDDILLSGRWDYLVVYADRLGAAYSGWSLTTFCPHPEWND